MQSSKQHYHFIGISGIGMSSIAKVLAAQGHTISGCDTNIDPTVVQELIDLQCTIAPKHESPSCFDPSITTIVYNSFISPQHPELVHAQAHGLEILHRSQLLAKIMATKKSIAVAGSHGKTSTSALMSHILIASKRDPICIVGGIISSIKSNAYCGSGPYLVAESDESDRSFLSLPKTYTIVTNIDIEHLETYTDFDDIKHSFIQFMEDIPASGANIICMDDSGVRSVIPSLTKPYLTYGQHEQADIQIKNIQLFADSSTGQVYDKKTNAILGTITLQQPGFHYLLNATGATAMALHLGIAFTDIQAALQSFTGVERRFSFKGISTKHQAHIFDDYGHHPLAIHYALLVARQKTKGKVIVVFQPHRFSRTKHLWHDFIKIFSSNTIDTLIITDIYPAFEQPIAGISSKQLVQELNQINPDKTIIYCPADPALQAISDLLDTHLQKDDLLLLLGAGKVHQLATKLIA